MVSARAGGEPGARSLELEPMPVEDVLERNRLADGQEVVFEWVLDGEPPEQSRLDVVAPPDFKDRCDSLAPRPSQVRPERTRFVARNRIEEPAEWLPETPLPRGRAMTRAGVQAQSNWLPVLLSVVAVAVLAIAVAALVIDGHRGTASPPEQTVPAQPAE